MNFDVFIADLKQSEFEAKPQKAIWLNISSHTKQLSIVYANADFSFCR